MKKNTKAKLMNSEKIEFSRQIIVSKMGFVYKHLSCFLMLYLLLAIINQETRFRKSSHCYLCNTKTLLVLILYCYRISLCAQICIVLIHILFKAFGYSKMSSKLDSAITYHNFHIILLIYNRISKICTDLLLLVYTSMLQNIPFNFFFTKRLLIMLESSFLRPNIIIYFNIKKKKLNVPCYTGRNSHSEPHAV